jgi:hypothetical protein
VSRHFGPPTRSNPLGELIKVQRTGSVAEYQDQFLKLLARCDGVTEQQQIAIYTTGLGDPLRIDVELQRPMTLEDAMGLSRAYERRIVTSDPPTLAVAPRQDWRRVPPRLHWSQSPSCSPRQQHQQPHRVRRSFTRLTT